MSKNIIAIVGESGSGKTVASWFLQQQFGWDAIVSYTTRPKRKGEIDGKDHWFVKPSQVPSPINMCAYTQFGGYEYWTEWNQFSTLFNSVYVIDEKGLLDLLAKDHTLIRFDIIKVKINRADKSGIAKERIKRDEERVSLPDDFYDYVIDNNGTLEEFKQKLTRIGQQIIKNQE